MDLPLTLVKGYRPSALTVMNAYANTYWVCGLFKNNVTVTADTVLSDLTAADYSGNGNQAVVLGSSTANVDGDGVATAATLTFAHNGGGTANTIYGAFIKDTNLNTLVAAGNLVDGLGSHTPKTMAASGDTIGVTLSDLLTQAT